MTWLVYDSSDTLLEQFVSNIDYSQCTTIQLSNGKTYNIEYASKVPNSNNGYIYIK